MNAKRILKFLKAVAANNNREWFAEHKSEYLECKADFEQAVDSAIVRIATFDPNIAHLTAKDCCYRFYRDIRFSEDKSPYKRHFGAYICERGKKSLRAGYYIHLQPQRCFVSCGAYWLPTNILTSCRNEIMANADDWLKCVENKAFQKYFGSPQTSSFKTPTDVSSWDQPQGFGLEKLKTCPSGFPRDWAHIDYLRMKDYCCWHQVPDNFYQGEKWLDEIEPMFKTAKPMMDFINSVIDDYE